MEPPSLNQILALLKLRAVRTSLLCLLLYPIVTYVVLRAPVKHRATMKILMSPYASKQPGSPTAIGVAMNARIHTIKTLLESYPLYEAVRRKLNEEAREEAPQEEEKSRLDTVLRQFIGSRGTEIVSIDDRDYTDFKSQIYFKPDFMGGNFEIGFDSINPAVAVRNTEIILDALFKLSSRLEGDRMADYKQGVDRKLVEAKASLTRTERALEKFAKEHGISGREDLQEMSKMSHEAESGFIKTELTVRELEIKLEQAKNLVRMLSKELRVRHKRDSAPSRQIALSEINRLESALLNADEIGMSTEERDQVRSRLQELYTSIGDNKNEELLGSGTLENQLSQAVGAVLKIETDLKVAKSHEKQLRKIVNQKSDKLKNLPALQMQYTELIRQKEQGSRLVSSLTEEALLAAVSSEEHFTRMTSIDAKPVLQAKLVRTHLKLLFGLIFATLLVVGGYLAIDLKMETVVVPTQLTRLGDPAFLGIFPRLRQLHPSDLITLCERDVGVGRLGYLLHHVFAGEDHKGHGKVIAVCSSKPESGRTVSAVGLATALANMGHSVLLLDADFRRQDVGKCCPGRSKRCRVAENLNALMNLIQTQGRALVPKGGFTVSRIFESATTPQQAVNFYEREFEPKLARLKAFFEYIIIDVAPLHYVDSLALIEHCDGAALCCRYGKSTIGQLTSAATLVRNYNPRGMTLVSFIVDAPVDSEMVESYPVPAALGAGGAKRIAERSS